MAPSLEPPLEEDAVVVGKSEPVRVMSQLLPLTSRPPFEFVEVIKQANPLPRDDVGLELAVLEEEDEEVEDEDEEVAEEESPEKLMTSPEVFSLDDPSTHWPISEQSCRRNIPKIERLVSSNSHH